MRISSSVVTRIGVCAAMTIAIGSASAQGEVAATAATEASSDGSGEAKQRLGDARNALPGVVHVAEAALFDRVVAASLTLGYGHLGAVIEANDSHHRASGSIAASYRPFPFLGLSIRYDNRYDRHVDLATGTDDGWLADTKFTARFVHALSQLLTIGADATVWFPPGGAPPSAAFDATSFEGLVLASIKPIDQLTFSANAGFRFDQSSKSVPNADMLSMSDRLALGVSDFNSIITGVSGSYGLGDIDLLAEVNWDILIGDGAPSATQSPIRIAGGLRWRATEIIQLQLMVQGSPSRVPQNPVMNQLYPIEPDITTMLSVGYSHPPKRDKVVFECWDGDIKERPQDCPPEPTFGDVLVVVVDESGAAIPNAQVKITVGTESPQTKTTGAEGNAEARKLPQGAVVVVVEADGYQSKTIKAQVQSNKETKLEVPLLQELPPGVLRGVIQSFRGTPLSANITVQPGDKSTTAAGDGSFEIEVDPGEYQVTIAADGFQEQTRTVVIKENGVTILNVDLRAEK